MRRPALLLLVLLWTALAAACTSASGPAWTYAPPTPTPPTTPAPSVDASAEPSGEAPSGEAPSGGGSGGNVVEVSAVGVAFEQAELSAPADEPFVLRFDNKDAGVPHNVEIKDAGGASVFKGEIFNGVAVKDYQVPALGAGTYQFVCTVHPNMVGTLTVGN
jgi:plastocyanin